MLTQQHLDTLIFQCQSLLPTRYSGTSLARTPRTLEICTPYPIVRINLVRVNEVLLYLVDSLKWIFGSVRILLVGSNYDPLRRTTDIQGSRYLTEVLISYELREIMTVPTNPWFLFFPN